uniref:Uncharacterized protein n=1 Tax=Photinus pyralis TaxID=7054 RepID=A0A1Y1KEW9_PHOPY
MSPIAIPLDQPASPSQKGWSWRACGDYRQRNASTIPDRYPLPHMQDVPQISQMPVEPADIGKTAITAPFGLFGLRATPSDDSGYAPAALVYGNSKVFVHPELVVRKEEVTATFLRIKAPTK